MAKKVAKKKSKKSEPKKPDYVASNMQITYSMPFGLVGMIAHAANKPVKEVWCQISEVCNICAFRLTKKPNQDSSWTVATFPGTKIQLDIEMTRRYSWDRTNHTYQSNGKFDCKIELGFSETESFTQGQINDYITEKIILGDDDEAETTIDKTECGTSSPTRNELKEEV